MKHDAIPGYRIERLIGKGGMASVYLAIQESLGRPVALKVLGDPESPEFSKRFVNEGRIIAGLSHTNIITVHDVGIADGQHYLSMEYVEGGDLTSRIAQVMTADVALDIVEKIASCLDFAHKRGVIHRDVKPANILFRDDGTPLLTDFGIAKHLKKSSDLTMTGTALGSPHYISPEQAQGKSPDGRTDIYSLGIILYDMLMGEKPYEGESDIATIVKHIQDPAPRLPVAYSRYQGLLNRMVAKDPKQRFADAGDVAELVKSLRTSACQVRDKGLSNGISIAAGARQIFHWPSWRNGLSGVAPGQKRIALALGTVLSIVFGALLVAHTNHSAGALEPARTAKAGGDQPLSQQHSRAEGNEKSQIRSEPKDVSPVRAVTLAPSTSTGVAQRTQAAEAPSSQQVAAVSSSRPRASATKREIERLLALADTSLTAYRLTTPPETSALHYYRQVLQLDPENKEAARGFIEITRRYSWLAQQRIDKGDYTTARRYIDLGLKVDPGNQGLLELKRNIGQLGKPSRHQSSKELEEWTGLLKRVEKLFR